MSPEEYLERLTDFQTQLNAKLPAFVAEQAMNAKQLIQSRIQEKGLNYKEASLGKYSETPLPLFFFDEKGGTKKATSKALKEQIKAYGDYLADENPNKKAFRVGLSYKHWRELNQRETDHVNLTFTRGGAGMFGSTGIVLEESSNGKAHVKVAGLDSFAQDKLDWNGERYGDILEVSKSEEALLFKNFESFLDGLITQTGI